MPLNHIRNPYSKLTAILLLICVAGTARAQEIEPCIIQGPTQVNLGGSAVYTIPSHCGVTSWTTKNGATAAQPTDSSVIIYFTNSGLTSDTITAVGSGATPLPVIVVSALNGGSITPPTQFQSPINYNSIPLGINATPATGGTCGGVYHYQWWSSTDNVNWTQIYGATGQNYQPGALTAPTNYFQREVTCGTQAYTNNEAYIDVCSQVTSGTISPSIQYISYGQTPPSQLSTSGAGGGCSTSYSYQWQSSPNNSTWTNVNGATGTTYSPPALTATSYYRLVVNSNGALAYSGSSEVFVYQPTGIAITPYTNNINYDSLPGTLTLSGYTGSLSNYTFQWQSSASSTFSSPTNVGTNSTTYTPGNLTATTYYRVQVTNNGVVGFSDTATVTVYPALNQGSISPRIYEINYNTAPGPFKVQAYAGGNGSYSFQWEVSAIQNFSTYTKVGGDSITYTPTTPDTVRTFYRCVVTSNGVSKATTINGQVFVEPPLVAGTLSPASQTVTGGTPAAILVSGTSGAGGGWIYQWQTALDTTKPSTWATITSQSDTSSSYNPPPNPGSTYYRVLVTDNITTSGFTSYASANTNWALVSVNLPLAGGTISGPSGTIPYNTSPGTLGSTQDATGGLCYPADFRYQWQFSIDGINFYSVVGATANTYTPAPLTASIYFRRQVSCSGHTFNSNTIYIQVAIGTQQNCTVSP